MPQEPNPLDFFSGGVPAFEILMVHLDSISELLQIPFAGSDATLLELAYIGVVSYTEAFFKDHFAAVLNIFPEKTALLRNAGRDVAVDVTDLLGLEDPLHHKFGFLLSERFNFGSPKAVNGLYRDLLVITPFSKDKVLSFDRVLATRNLLVHHGGLLTAQFQRGIANPRQGRRYFDSLRITKEQVGEAALLALGVIRDSVNATMSKLSKELEDAPSVDIRRQALESMRYDEDEEGRLLSSLRFLATGESPDDDPPGVTDDEIPF